MKKSLVLALLSLMSVSSFAETVLRIPLHVEENQKFVSTAEINKRYNLKGNEKLIEVLEVSSNDPQAAHKKYYNEYSRVEALAEQKKANFFLTGEIPGTTYEDDLSSCYQGSPAETINIIGTMADGIYSDQLRVIAWKYKKEAHYVDEWDEVSVMDEYMSEGSQLWAKWVGYNDTILVLSSESDGGDDVNEGLIKACK